MVIGTALSPFAASVRAHDIPDERVDRGIEVVLDPPALDITYEVGLSEWTLYQDLKRLDATGPRPVAGVELLDRYGRLVASLNANGLLAAVDGEALTWRVEGFEVEVAEHPLYRFRFEATVPDRGSLTLLDTNYESSFGTGRLAFRAAPGVQVEGFDGPTRLAEVAEVPAWALSDAEEEATKRLVVEYRPGIAESGAGAGGRPLRSPEASESAGDGLSPRRGGLSSLLLASGGRPAPALFLLALLLGAAHAVQPGHGKTVLLAAVSDGPRRMRRAVAMAMIVLGSHLATTFALALIVSSLVRGDLERANDVLLRVTGVLLGLLGCWRLGRRVGGHEAPGDPSESPGASTRGTALAAAGVGLIPCWDAVLLLVLARVMGVGPRAFGLVLAFGAGSALTLAGLGVAVISMRGAVGRWAGHRRLDAALGWSGAALLAVIGAHLALRP